VVQNGYLPFAAQHNEPNSLTLGNVTTDHLKKVLNEDAGSSPSSHPILY